MSSLSAEVGGRRTEGRQRTQRLALLTSKEQQRTADHDRPHASPSGNVDRPPVLYRESDRSDYLEKFIHPRWARPLEATKRVAGTIVMLLSIALVFAPIPLSNIVPALVIALISVAYLEEDGLLLLIAMLAAVIVLTAAFAAVWETVLGANWIAALR
jgi:hypothetical protein